MDWTAIRLNKVSRGKVCEELRCKEGGQEKRKGGSGATEQGTDQQGRSGNGEAMNKLNKQVKQVKQGKQVESSSKLKTWSTGYLCENGEKATKWPVRRAHPI